MKKTLILLIALILTGCSTTINQEASQEDVKNFFQSHKIGDSPDYAVIKNGTDYLMTIHGFADDESVCLELIKPYNKDSSLSIIPGAYSCVQLNN